MRQVKIFSGSSHPLLTDAICDRLGTQAARCDLGKFSNGETKVGVETSVRDQDVFILQSGSSQMNDSVMELLVMIAACKGGSAKSITAVMPYFPYSRQSKKKSHRGAITARLLANLLSIAGVHHIITVDLHATQMRGFFGKPVDDLHAEPLIARWIRNHVPGWNDAVVVSKNPGGTKRVTSLADVLRLSFGMVSTDRRRFPMNGSMILEGSGFLASMGDGSFDVDRHITTEARHSPEQGLTNGTANITPEPQTPPSLAQTNDAPTSLPHRHLNEPMDPSPLAQSTRVESQSPPRPVTRLIRTVTAPPALQDTEEYNDERAREVITGRLIHGHIVDDNHPSPALSFMSGSIAALPGELLGPSQLDERDRDPMISSFISTSSLTYQDHPLGGTYDAAVSEGEEEEGINNPELEHTITLVGNVKDKTVFLVDDIIDKSGTWIAAAETVVKRGGATKVYCIATHGLFGGESLQDMEECECIDYIVVTNSFPIDPDQIRVSRKLVILDLSNLLAEAIRRNHHGESISQLYRHYPD